MLPNWIPEQAWEAYLEMRRKMGSKYRATEYAKQLLIKRLGGFKNEGMNIEAVIEQSIMRSWTGLFPVKEQKKDLGKWWDTSESIAAKAQELHLQPKPGETADLFKQRINAVIRHGGVEAILPTRQYQAEATQSTLSRETARAELQRAIALTKRH